MNNPQDPVEAAAIAAFEAIGMGSQVRWTDPHVTEGRQDIWRSAQRAAILAYLSAIAEDEASVEAVAGTVAEGFYFGMPQVDPDAVPDGLARDVARAVLRTLLERAKSPDPLGDGP